jgi:hypothetical protein
VITGNFILKTVKIETILSCPYCGKQQRVFMSLSGVKSSLYCFFCEQKIFSKDGVCCVFCSYGSAKCPVAQEKEYPIPDKKISPVYATELFEKLAMTSN